MADQQTVQSTGNGSGFSVEHLSVNLTDLTGNTKKFEVNIQKPLVDAAFEEEFKRIRKDEQIPGFRRGKAPIGLISSRYRSLAEGQVMQKLFEAHLTNIFKVSNESPLGIPRIEQEFTITTESNFVFSFTVDCEPKFEPVGYKGVQVDLLKVVPEEQFEKFLTKTRFEHATYTELENTPAVKGNRVKYLIDGTVGDEKVGEESAVDQETVIGEGQTLPNTPFESELIGKKTGDTFTFKYALPEDYEIESLQGKEVDLTVRVLHVESVELPEIDDEFVETVLKQQQTAAEWLDSERKQLTDKFKTERRQAIIDTVINELIDKNPLEISGAVIEAEIRSQYDLSKITSYQYQYLFFSTRRRLATDILLKNLVRSLDLKATEDEIDKAVLKLAEESHRDDFDTFKEELKASGRLDDVEDGILREKVEEILLENAVVTEHAPAEFRALKKRKAAEARAAAEAKAAEEAAAEAAAAAEQPSAEPAAE